MLVVLATCLLVVAGLYAAIRLPIDAIPDVTTKQVVVNTSAPALSPEEIERQITRPLELALAGVPRVVSMRSISQFGLSQITLEFEDSADTYLARQIVDERISEAREELPPGTDPPTLAPVATGLGEIIYIFVESDDLSLMEKREVLDWHVKPRLRTVPGIIEVNTFGGHVKQYQVLADPVKMRALGVSLTELEEALEKNNRNAGGGYVKKANEQQVVQGIGLVKDLNDLRNIVLHSSKGAPVLVRDVATVEFGHAVRQGTITKDGKGEAVAAIAVMLMGENSRTVTEAVKDRIELIKKELPAHVQITTFLDRSKLVNETLKTAGNNLLHGGLLVILVLFLFLLQFRAGLIVSSAIPLAMLFAIVGMYAFGISANLMSLGAIDFGLIVDAAVIIVENCVRRLSEQRHKLGRELTEEERLHTIREGSVEVRQASQFGEIIIIAAYLPVLSLVGVEGKMFRPMGLTVILALVGALILSATLIPALCAYFLKADEERENPIIKWLQARYLPVVRWSVKQRVPVILGASVFFLLTLSLFPRLGSEFLPELDEGAVTINPGYLPGISIETAIERAALVERVLLDKFPDEVESAATRIGRPDIATDPMLLSQHDVLIPLKPRSQWKKAKTKEELIKAMEVAMADVPGMKMSFTQPIKMRMSEMSEGVGIRSDIGVKVFGPDIPTLQQLAIAIADQMREVKGGTDVAVEATAGLPMLKVHVRRDDLARYNVNVADVNHVVETAIGGSVVGKVYEGEKSFDVLLRYSDEFRNSADSIQLLTVESESGQFIPLLDLADIETLESSVQINREEGERRIVIQANVRDRDLGSYVEEVKQKVEKSVKLPPGYHIQWSGQYEHLQSGRARLAVVVPITFGIILLLLFITYRRFFDALRVFTGIPFAVSGGILALWLRGMPFSMSAGVGFIALSGIAVLADMVMVQTIRNNLDRGLAMLVAVEEAAITRLRPVLMTATVAAIGFLPMAISTGTGAEVQRPLATVVIGGLITSTLLTLVVLPALYLLISKKREAKQPQELLK